MTDFTIKFDEIDPASIKWNGDRGEVELVVRAVEATTGYASGNAGGSGSCSGNAGQNNGSGVSNGQGSNSSNTTYRAWVSLYASTDNRFDTADILLSRTQGHLENC